jgi:hypothetical protein
VLLLIGASFRADAAVDRARQLGGVTAARALTHHVVQRLSHRACPYSRAPFMRQVSQEAKFLSAFMRQMSQEAKKIGGFGV